MQPGLYKTTCVNWSYNQHDKIRVANTGRVYVDQESAKRFTDFRKGDGWVATELGSSVVIGQRSSSPRISLLCPKPNAWTKNSDCFCRRYSPKPNCSWLILWNSMNNKEIQISILPGRRFHKVHKSGRGAGTELTFIMKYEIPSGEESHGSQFWWRWR